MAVIHNVICEETGEQWQTITECAKALGKSPTCIRGKIIFHEPVNGKHYRYGEMLYRDREGNVRPIYSSRTT